MNRLPPLKTRLITSAALLVIAAPMVVLALVPDLSEPVQGALSATFVFSAFGFTGWKIWCDWRRYDEAQQAAHRWASATGAVLGLVFALILLPLVVMAFDDRVDRLMAGEPPSGLLAIGAFAVILPQVLGYLVAQAFWWRRRR